MLELTPSCFDMAQHKIYMLMAKDCYPRFLRSPAYRDLVYQAKPSATATKQPQQEKKAWKHSVSQWYIVSSHLNGWEGKRSAMQVLHHEAGRGCRQRLSWEQKSMGVWRSTEELKWKKNLCLKCINADDVWRAKKSESVTIWQSNRGAGGAGPFFAN